MGYRFPSTISAARVATFVSTAAWIQGTAASDVSLPEEALNNFLRRHRVQDITARQDPALGSPPSPPSLGQEPEEEESEISEDTDATSEDEPEGPGGLNGKENQAAAAVDASGQAVIESADTPPLSPGAQAAIGVWVTLAVLAIAVGAYFLYKRRRRSRAAQEVRSLRDVEFARSQASSQPMPQQGEMPAVANAVHLRGGGDDSSSNSAPSGRWVPTPPWQEDIPTWRDSQPWRQSMPLNAAAQPVVGLPSNPSPIARAAVGGIAAKDRTKVYDQRTEYTAETESTIFGYR